RHVHHETRRHGAIRHGGRKNQAEDQRQGGEGLRADDQFEDSIAGQQRGAGPPLTMALFRDTPIQRKLMTMILVTSGVVLALTCAAFIGCEWLTYRPVAVQQLATLGEIIAAESTGAMAFDDQRNATEILGALKAERQIVAACLYDKSGKIFSRYPAEAPDGAFPVAPRADGYRFVGGHLEGFTPVV